METWSGWLAMKITKKRYPEYAPKRIDIGCGYPDQVYPECIGIDMFKDCHPDILYDLNKKIPFKNESVEFVNSDNSLEHFKNPIYTIREIYRVLIKKGTLRLVLPNSRFFPLLLVNIFWDLDSAWYWWMQRKPDRSIHWSHWTKNHIVRILEDEGFEILIKAKGTIFHKEIYIYARKR